MAATPPRLRSRSRRLIQSSTKPKALRRLASLIRRPHPSRLQKSQRTSQTFRLRKRWLISHRLSSSTSSTISPNVPGEHDELMTELFGEGYVELLGDGDEVDDDEVIPPDAVVADVEHLDDHGDAGATVSAPSAGPNVPAGSGATVSGSLVTPRARLNGGTSSLDCTPRRRSRRQRRIKRQHLQLRPRPCRLPKYSSWPIGMRRPISPLAA